MSENTPKWTICLALTYGLLVAVGYIFVRTVSNDGGILLFTLGSIFCAIIHFVISFGKLKRVVFNKFAIIRGISFSLAQILLLTAQQNGDTSTMFSASIIGIVIGTLFSTILLRDRVSVYSILAFFIAIIASLLNKNVILISYCAVIGGFLQGVTILLGRTLAINRDIDPSSIVGTTFLYSSIVMILYNILGIGQSISLISSYSWTTIAFIPVLLLIIQYGQVLLLKYYSTEKVSIMMLSRVPYSYLLELGYFAVAFSFSKSISVSLFFVSGVLLYVDRKQYHNHQ